MTAVSQWKIAPCRQCGLTWLSRTSDGWECPDCGTVYEARQSALTEAHRL